jgi:N-acetylneuraminic acid mutarotase
MGVLGLLLAVLVLSGTPLPGPHLKKTLGLVDSPPPTKRCVPRPDRVRGSARAVAAGARWRREPRTPEARNEAMAATAGHSVYLVGGQVLVDHRRFKSLTSVVEFQPQSRRFRRAPPLPQPLDHVLAVGYRGSVYVVGGDSNDTPSNRLWRYSPQSRRWTELARMRVARMALAGEVIGNRLYVVGGTVNDTRPPYPALEIYDFARNRWTPGPDMPTARHHLAAAALGGRLYVLGGRRLGDFSLDAFERFDPRSQRWERLRPIPQGVGALGAAATHREFIAVGGGDDHQDWVTPATWAYDPARNRWRRLPDLRVPRHAHGTAIAGDRLYVLAGAPCAGYGETDAVESLPVG